MKLSKVSRDKETGRVTFTLFETTYRTYSDGFGLEVEQLNGEWKQIEGLAQFNLAYGNRRAKVIEWAIHRFEWVKTAYGDWLELRGDRPTQRNEVEFWNEVIEQKA